MKFIDTHTHLFSEQFNEDRHEMVDRAIAAGVDKMFLPNIDLASVQTMHDLVEQYPTHCFPMIGLHPCSVDENWEEDLAVLKNHLENNKYCAIGEIGMDLYWDKTKLEFQDLAFREQIKWAKEKELPIAIHVREAFDECLAIIDEVNDERLTGVFHCFTGTKAQADHIINYGGFKLGIGGVLTFKNSGLDKVIQEVDLKHLILETDAPYLAPTPYRGKRNLSEYIPLIATKLAEVHQISMDEVAEQTTKNALSLFRI